MLKPFHEFLNEEAVSLTEEIHRFHNIATKHEYRLGTSIGTQGYVNPNGGFSHVFHRSDGHEVHVHSDKEGKVRGWVHVDKTGKRMRQGVEHKELHSHLSDIHPEVAEKAKKEREAKAKSAEKKLRDDTLAKKQGQLLDKLIRSNKLPSVALNGTPKQPSQGSSAKKKAKK